MSAKRATTLAASGVAAYVVLGGIGLTLKLGAPQVDLPGDEESVPALEVAFALVLLVFTIVGATIASRRPRHPVGWLLLAMGVLSALGAFCQGYALQGLVTDPGSLPYGEWFAWVSSSLDSSSMGLVILLLLLFPDGRLVSRRWRVMVWLTLIAVALIFVDVWFTPGRLYGFEDVQNPIGINAAGFLRDVDPTGPAVLLLFPVAVVGLFVKRRRATAEVRLQLKWFMSAAALLVAVLLVATVAEAVFLEDSKTASLIGGFVFAGLFAFLAISIGIAVLRYRLYDIDLVIRRTAVYGALTLTLLASYLGLVLVLQQVLSPDSDFAIAGSTLTVAALVRPALSRIQELVDRRFYRRRYDAAHTIEAFGARLRDQVDLEALGGELRGVVADTMQPAHVSLWLRPSEQRA